MPASLTACCSWEYRRHKHNLQKCFTVSPRSSLLLFCFCARLQGKADPLHPVWHIKHFYWWFGKTAVHFPCTCMIQSDWLFFSAKSSQCHHGKSKSCVCATEIGECEEYSLCFSGLLWPFKTMECSAPTWCIASDCHRYIDLCLQKELFPPACKKTSSQMLFKQLHNKELFNISD